MRGGCAEGGVEGRVGGVGALDLIYVCGVQGRGEGAQGEESGVGWRDGVRVEVEDVGD